MEALISSALFVASMAFLYWLLLSKRGPVGHRVERRKRLRNARFADCDDKSKSGG